MIFAGVARIGNEPEVRYTKNGDPVVELNLAYNYGRRVDDGKKPTQWMYGSLWGKRAEVLLPYLNKGNQIFVQVQDLHVHEYEKKDGTKGVALRGRIGELELLAGRPEQKPSEHEKAKANGFQPEFDDDLPF